MTEKPETEKEEIARLKAEVATALAEKAKSENKYKELLKHREQKAAATRPEQTPAPPATPPAETHSEEEHGHAEGKPHYIGAWQRFCPTCGDPNPDFKDETICDDCKTHLGAFEVASKLKACPNCGGHKASRIKK